MFKTETICPTCGHQKTRKDRSLNQNAAYWKLIIEPLAEYLALDKMETHFLVKHKFLREIRNVIRTDRGVEELIITKSTTDLSTIEHNEFCSKIRMWASELGCYLKEPNENP